jgi:hypothetical protein
VGGAEREDGAPGGSGGDFVERGDELGVDLGEAWWFWINQRNQIQKAERMKNLLRYRQFICLHWSVQGDLARTTDMQKCIQLGTHQLEINPWFCIPRCSWCPFATDTYPSLSETFDCGHIGWRTTFLCIMTIQKPENTSCRSRVS